MVAQSRAPQIDPDIPQAAWSWPGVWTGELGAVVRYADGSGVHCTWRGCFAPAGADAGPLNDWIGQGGAVSGCFDLPRSTLLALMARASARTGLPAPDLTQCFRLTGAGDVPRTLSLASRAAGVEDSYLEAFPVPQDDPDTPDFSDRQWYLDTFEEAEGMGYRAVWELHGALGAGVRVLDIEGAFNVNHEDLTTARHADLWPGSGTSLLDDDDHATAALGLIVAQHNGYGMDGLAPAAEPLFAGLVTREYAWGVGPAILRQLQSLGPGDMLFLIVSVPGPRSMGNGNQGNLPMESQRAEFDAISLATDLGVIVLNAGGNGLENLDDEIYAGLFDRNLRDSGAIFVCGGIPPGQDNPARSPIWFTNRGSRCDVQAYASNLPTPGYGELFGEGEHDRLYTSSFGGTSGATPLVTGLAALLQSIARARGKVLLPDGMRRLLVATGTQQPEGVHIGPLPDGPRAAAAIDTYAVDLPAPVDGPPQMGQACLGVCADGLTCVEPVSGEGYCLRVCDPFQGTGCEEGLVCALQVTGDGQCVVPSGGGAGAACAIQSDCGPNTLCVAEVCAPLCSVRQQRPCADSEVCVPRTNLGLDWGACVERPTENTPPILWPVGDRRVREGQRLDITLEATDVRGDPLTFSVTGLPRGATFDAEPAVFSWTPQLGQQGVYEVTFRVDDPEGRAAREVVRFFVVPGPLTARIDSPTDGTPLSTDSPRVSGATHRGAQVEVRRAGGEDDGQVLCEATATDTGSFLCVCAPLLDGEHALVAVPIDAHGREGQPSGVVHVLIDTIPPGVPSLTGPLSTNEVPVRFEGTAEAGNVRVFVFDEDAEVLCAGDTAEGEAGSWDWSCTAGRDHAEGEHTVVLRARDGAGNRSADSEPVGFAVDLTAPAAPSITAPSAGARAPADTELAVEGQSEEGTVQVRSGALSCVAEAAGGFWTCVLPASGAGEQVIEAVVTDDAGNAGPPAQLTLTRVAPAVVVAIEVPTPTEEVQPVIWVTTENADAATVEVDGNEVCSAAAPEVDVARFTCTPPALELGVHDVEVVAFVDGGASSAPFSSTFEVVAVPGPAVPKSGKTGGCATASSVSRWLWPRRR